MVTLRATLTSSLERGTAESPPLRVVPNKGSNPRTIDAAEGTIVVKAPVADGYRRWLVFEDYPQFVSAIKRVRKLDANHFVASLGLTESNTTPHLR